MNTEKKHPAYAMRRHGKAFRWVEVGVAKLRSDGTGFDVFLDTLPVAGFNGYLHIPTVSLDVISLVAGSCGYYRGQIEPRAAQ